METHLKPCPFCGGTDLEVLEECQIIYSESDYLYVQCQHCYAHLQLEPFNKQTACWNTRAYAKSKKSICINCGLESNKTFLTCTECLDKIDKGVDVEGIMDTIELAMAKNNIQMIGGVKLEFAGRGMFKGHKINNWHWLKEALLKHFGKGE